MQEQNLNCWICGSKINSGEHKIKKSDLELLYPEVSQAQPIFHRTNGDKKRHIGGTKANALKYPKSICSLCNGALTQSHDYSWEKLSAFLFNHATEIQEDKEVDLTTVFENGLNDNVINIQLFFAKQFGCKIIESGREFDLEQIGSSILSNKEIPSLYLKLRCSNNGKSKSYTASSDLELGKQKNGELGYIHFF